jgi:hypothetical protein
VLHIGRKPHRRYRTPVMVFRRRDHFVIALTYGRESQWVQNVLNKEIANWKHRVRSRCRSRASSMTRSSAMPPIVRVALGVLNVSDFLELALSNE